jgi:hypothetical protein
MTKQKLKPILCGKCGHDMKHSRVKMATMTARCGKCKTVHDVSLTPIPIDEDTTLEVSPRLEGDTSNEPGREELD